jgi:hypothetical protein
MKIQRQPVRLVIAAAIGLITVVSLVTISSATGNINKGDLAGTWQISLGGFTGCGQATELAVVTLNAAGTGTGTLQTHGACADTTLTGQTFTINTVSAKGSGTAGLTCGTSCGWTLAIQVSPDRSSMSLVDMSDPGNYLVGTAVHQ